jgi:hypothetical protein
VLTWTRSSQRLRGRWLYSPGKGPAHGLIGLILDGYITKMGFRVRKSDETEKMKLHVNGLAKKTHFIMFTSRRMRTY